MRPTRRVLARPAPGESMAGGVIIEASIVARLLGLKLLRLRADVTLVPARVDGIVHPLAAQTPTAAPAPPVTPRSVGPGTLADAVQLLDHASATLERGSRDRNSTGTRRAV
jgi:hypothetical protein